MGRVRFVEGKLTENVEEHLSYYSAADITESSGINYLENSEAQIIHGGDPEFPPLNPQPTKIIVQFRPHKDWKGEFGFD